MKDLENKYCNCLYYSANALARKLTRMAEEEFAITGLSPSYAFLLLSVNSHEGIQPSELSQLMQLSPSTVTRLMEKMESKDYIRRETSGRKTEVYPTDAGKELEPKIKKAWKQLYHRYAELIGEEQAKNLTQLSYAASKALEG